MRFLVASALCLVVSQTSASPVEKRQDPNAIANLLGSLFNAGYGKVPDIPGAAPRRVELTSRTPKIAGSKTVKIRYGPYKVPNASKKIPTGESGTLYNYPDLKVEKPCEECILLGIAAGLEYPDGKNANVANGMWLHHMVAFTKGPGRMDPPCVGTLSLPHMAIGSDASKSERFYSSGNERSEARFTPPWAKPEDPILGYHLNPTDKFAFIVDLMNQNMEDKTVYMTMTYDYVEGRPKGIENVKAIWLDAAQCGTSEIPPPTQDGNYSIKYPWVANIEGEILGAGGHLHDGGTHLTLDVNGKQVCDSVATYGVKGGMSSGAMAGKGGESSTHSKATEVAPVQHITSMSSCFGKTLGIKQLKKGQVWTLEAFYAYNKHPGMKKADGKQENVMGISIMYVKNPRL